MADKIHAWEVIIRGTEDGAEVLHPYASEPVLLSPGQRMKLTTETRLQVALSADDQPEPGEPPAPKLGDLWRCRCGEEWIEDEERRSDLPAECWHCGRYMVRVSPEPSSATQGVGDGC